MNTQQAVTRCSDCFGRVHYDPESHTAFFAVEAHRLSGKCRAANVKAERRMRRVGT